jgi:hypothetical protein
MLSKKRKYEDGNRGFETEWEEVFLFLERNQIHTYVHTYIHTYVHTYTHTCIYTHTHTFSRYSSLRWHSYVQREHKRCISRASADDTTFSTSSKNFQTLQFEFVTLSAEIFLFSTKIYVSK